MKVQEWRKSTGRSRGRRERMDDWMTPKRKLRVRKKDLMKELFNSVRWINRKMFGKMEK